MSVWTAIFRAGTHTDSAGQTRAWTIADLDRAVASYDPARHQAPLVIGHPRTDAPAWGWVGQLRREGDRLLARLDDVPEELKQAVAAGRYRHKSAAFYGDGGLRHVGLLGAAPPAVKGLGPVEFGGDDDWQEWAFGEGAEQTTEETMNELEEMKARLAQLEAKAQAAESKAAQAEAAAAQAEKDRRAAEAAHAEAQQKQAAKDREARFNELVAGGKCLPGEKDAALAIAAALEAGVELCFAEGGAVVRRPAEEAFWSLLASRPGSGLLGEFAQAPGSTESQAAPRADFAAKF